MQDFQKASEVDPNFAEAYNAIGMTFSAMGSDNLAAQCFAKACQLDGSSLLAQCNWASALANLGEYDQAQARYREILDSTAGVLTARERALVYNNSGVCHYLKGDLDQAAQRIMEACQIDQNLTESAINLGLIRTKLREFEFAAEAFEKLLVNDEAAPPEVSMYLGVTSLLTGKYQAALEQLAQAQSRGVRNPEWDIWMGYAHLASGRAQTAQLHFERASQEKSLSHLGFDGIGCCLLLIDEYDKAIECFHQALAIKPEFALAHLHLARSLEAKGQVEASKEEYRKAIDLDPSCLLPEKEIIETLLANLDFESALNRSLKILEIEPVDLDARLSLTQALKAQNRLDEAFELIESIIAAHPENGRAKCEAGQILMSLGRLSEADEMFRSACELDDVEASLYFAWGKTLALLGFYEMALEKYQKASEIDPYDEDIYELWGGTLKALGRFSEAADVFKRASDYLYE
jgi:tetratricopeptide (TPR) repeat protein